MGFRVERETWPGAICSCPCDAVASCCHTKLLRDTTITIVLRDDKRMIFEQINKEIFTFVEEVDRFSA
jgi:hypothetical protein